MTQAELVKALADVIDMWSGHACPRCDGIGSIRIRTGNGSQRVPCVECGGAGTQRPGPRRREDR